jgi:thiopeptide-type bacteriocin biosynthesis protein
MKCNYSFHPNIVLRTPAYPFHPDIDKAFIVNCLSDEGFTEALYLASPSLYEECQKWRQGDMHDPKKVERMYMSMARYYLRMSSRCTPFGLLAGCSVIEWAEDTHLVLEAGNAGRHTRLDMHYVCALARWLAAAGPIKDQLIYYTNSSLYCLGDETRYVEYGYVNDARVYNVSSVLRSQYLDQVLAACQKGATRMELALVLADDDTGQDEALDFIDSLIEAQVLVSELEPVVTGKEFAKHIGGVLARLRCASGLAAIGAVEQTLNQVHQALRSLDREGVNSVDAYKSIIASLEALDVPIESNKLFQADLTPRLAAGSLDCALQRELTEALAVLRCLTPDRTQERLAEFKRKFNVRYEDREVPLLEALDAENGIDYSDYSRSGQSALVNDLVLSGPAWQRVVSQNEVQHLMYQKLREADRNRQYSVEIREEELQPFLPGAAALPPSVSVVFRLVDHRRVLLESVGGSSAANLLGRFAHADPRIDQLVRDITAREQQHNPDVLLAEIAYLPESRTGNILQRPTFRQFEIPYLSQSTLPAAQQLPLQDLTIAMQNGQLVVRSRKYNRVVVPRLSAAHNFSHQSLPVYQFLCDLQTQNLQPHLGFSWESVSLYTKFLPRLTYKNIILQGAAWQLDEADLAGLLDEKADLAGRFAAFRERWQLPRYFTLADGDNELLVDAGNLYTVAVWLDTIKNRKSVKLKEYLFDAAESPVRDQAGRPYANQFIAALIAQHTCYPAVKNDPPAPHPAVQREYTLGSEWLYFKQYCGVMVADRILLEAVKPLTEELLQKGYIDKWFFVRYADPHHHLRLRFHLPDVSRLAEVLVQVQQYMQPYLSKGYIWKSQTDTYRRELERYGPRTIELTESLFYYQSAACLEVLDRNHAPDGGDCTNFYWMAGMRSIEDLLDAFDYGLPEKMALLCGMKETFAQEFGMDKHLKLQLDAKYRHYRAGIDQAMGRAHGRAAPGGEACWPGTLPGPVREIARAILQLDRQDRLEVSLGCLLGSYIHMLLNRLVPNEPRLHEMIIYDFMYRHYQSRQYQSQKVAPRKVVRER